MDDGSAIECEQEKKHTTKKPNKKDLMKKHDGVACVCKHSISFLTLPRPTAPKIEGKREFC